MYPYQPASAKGTGVADYTSLYDVIQLSFSKRNGAYRSQLILQLEDID